LKAAQTAQEKAKKKVRAWHGPTYMCGNRMLHVCRVHQREHGGSTAINLLHMVPCMLDAHDTALKAAVAEAESKPGAPDLVCIDARFPHLHAGCAS
jgi:hypothetical protein